MMGEIRDEESTTGGAGPELTCRQRRRTKNDQARTALASVNRIGHGLKACLRST
jgi:hypothetical protein